MTYTLHIPAVYLDSNSTWHSSLGGVSVITHGEDVHGTQGPTSGVPQTNYKPVAMAWGQACFCRTRPAGSRTSHSTSTSPTRHPVPY
jgi:hypothetical protein